MARGWCHPRPALPCGGGIDKMVLGGCGVYSLVWLPLPQPSPNHTTPPLGTTNTSKNEI